AAKAADFSVFSAPNRLHPEWTIGRACYDDSNLYISAECHVDEMEKFKGRLAEIAGDFEYDKGGVVEVFIDANRDQETFQQYLLHANGSSMITLSPGDVFKILNEDYLASRATVTDEGYTIEMSFPFAMLHLHPDTAAVWGFNLNRSHDLYYENYDKNGFFSSWNSTRGLGFQTPELFGELSIDADFSRFFWDVDFAAEPQPGDAAIQLRVKNETGEDFSGEAALALTQLDGTQARHERPVALQAGAEKAISFEHSVSAEDTEAKYEVSIIDADARVCYLGGTQKQDLTPRDEWPVPTPSRRQRAARHMVFSRPYTHPALYRSVPRPEEVVSELSVAACRGEFEPRTFSLYPLQDVRSLQVEVNDLRGPGKATIPKESLDLRKVAWQSVWENPKAFEAREHLLRKADGASLAKGRSVRFWLTVKVPSDARPGNYRGKVTLISDGAVTRIPLTVRVLPFELSPPDDMGYFMYYPGANDQWFSNAPFFEKTVADMREHGMSTFTIYNWATVTDPDTDQTRLDLDEREADNYGVTYAQMMEMLQEAGLGVDAPLLDVFSMYYPPEIIVELDEIVRERGWPEVLFYICDEIEYPERIERARKILDAIKELAPDIKTTTALGPKGAAALGEMYDVWIGCSKPEMVSHCLSLGQQPWTYSCRAVHEVSVAYERYFFGRYAWKLGLKGVGLWSYAEDDSFYDRFGRQHGYANDFVFTPEWKHRYGHVIFEDDEIIPTVTWEGVREGIDDYRYMLTLRKLAENAVDGDSASGRAAGRAGLDLLDDITDEIDFTPALNDYSGSEYLLDWRLMGDMHAARARIIEAILDILEDEDR
ncbi:MAG TPA: sugar-binding protein, partial [Armatimonadota bacterium]|nr:sugar-binding protein [Armatimonadota bacterium]